MIFASPWWLLLFLLAGVIALLHSRPRRNVEVSSLLLWRHSSNVAPPRASRKLPVPNLLMLLQILVLALIALALARPLLGSRAGGIDHWIVMLDASGRMQAGSGGATAFEEAREHLAGSLRREEGSPSRISLVRVASEPSIEGARLPRADQVRGTLDALEPSHAPADWGRAAALLPGLLLEGERTRVTILSDPAGTASARASIAAILPDVTIEEVSFGRSAVNLALARVTPALVDGVPGAWRVSGEIHAFAGGDGAGPGGSVPLRVLFEPAGATGALEWTAFEIDLSADGVTPFQLGLTLPGAGRLEIRLPDDELPHDSRAHFILHAAPVQARVLYVGRGNPPLGRALNAVSGVQVTRMSALPESDAGYDLVILDGVRPSRRPTVSALWLGVSPDGADSPRMEDASPTSWVDRHPLAGSVDWRSLSVGAARRFPLLPGAEAVVESSGVPLLQARTTLSGREVVVAFDLADSNWPELLGFPAFVVNLLRWTVPELGTAVAATCTAGFPCPLHPSEVTGGWRIVGPGAEASPLPAYFVGGEDAASGEAWLPPRLEAAFTPQRSGIYTLQSEGRRRLVAVNALFTAEGDLSTGGGAGDLSTGGGAGDLSTGGGAGGAVGSAQLSAGRWLLLLAVAALLAEAWIAGRKSERFLRREGLARDNPLAGRRRLILALRGGELVLLALALLNFRGLYPLREADAVLVMDDPGTHEAATDDAARSVLSTAAGEASRSRRFGMVRIGAESRIASDVGGDLERADSSIAEGVGADLGTALQMAGALLPRESGGRIVLVSDGRETRGTVEGALPGLLARRLPIDVRLLPEQATDDVSVDRVTLPGIIRRGETVKLHGVITSSYPATGIARLWRDGMLETERSIELLPGRTRAEFEILEENPGVYLYEVEVEAPGDGTPENNRNGLLVEVLSAPRVGIVTPQPSWGRALADAMAIQGITSEVMTPDRAPVSAAPDASGRRVWTDFDVVALMNVPASELSTSGLEALEVWVRDSGGGLMIIGGENSFGPGGYFDTPLENLSPLSAKIPQELPNLAIVFVLDRSGSMAAAAGAGSRLDIAKLATLEAIELLDPESLVGVVAFDSNAHLAVPIQRAGNLEAVSEQLGSLATGGGTWIFPGLGLAFVELSKIDPDFRRHIVVMTDGLSRRADYRPLLASIVAEGMTVSTAAIGEGADVGLLEELARLGGGAAHVTMDFGDLPSILAREASRFSSGPVRDEPLNPMWRSRDTPFLQAFPQEPPALQGFVRTTAKPGARVHLEGDDDVPLLASWRFGLGRVVSFASHGAGPWAADWMASADYGIWWAQLARWAVPAAAGPGLHLQVTRQKDYGRLVLEAVGSDGLPVDGLALEAAIVAPDVPTSTSIRLLESEPGIYEGSFIADRPGAYSVFVGSEAGAGGSGVGLEAEGKLYVGYPSRYEAGLSDAELLRTLARVSGGRVLTGDERLLEERVPIRWVRRSMWPFWAFLALLLFMLELFTRYGTWRPQRRVTSHPPGS